MRPAPKSCETIESLPIIMPSQTMAKTRKTAEPRLTAASAVGPTRPIMAMSTKFMDIHPTSPMHDGHGQAQQGGISRRMMRCRRMGCGRIGCGEFIAAFV